MITSLSVPSIRSNLGVEVRNRQRNLVFVFYLSNPSDDPVPLPWGLTLAPATVFEQQNGPAAGHAFRHEAAQAFRPGGGVEQAIAQERDEIFEFPSGKRSRLAHQRIEPLEDRFDGAKP